MKKILVLVEGQTEADFVSSFLSPLMFENNLSLVPKIITTKRVKSGSDFKGGIVKYDIFKSQVLALLGDSSADIVTTMIDYYHLPPDFPGYYPQESGEGHVRNIEAAIENDINNRRFVAYLQRHEFEALLFSSPIQIESEMNNGVVDANGPMQKVRSQYQSPEDINTTSSPGKKIEQAYPLYEKVLNGNRIARSIGLIEIRAQCVRFDSWLNKLV